MPISFLKRSIITFGLLTLGLFFSAAQAADEPVPIISRVTIRGSNIFDFDTMTYLRKFPYTWINKLHIQTKEYIIAQELLFKVGDPLDEFLIHETERNLRALSFIRSARVAQFPQRDGTVALVVFVKDSWTTEPQINLSGLNKLDSVQFGFKEKNLLGYGKNVSIFYNKVSGSVQRDITYYDPRLMHTRWQLKAKLANMSEGNSRSLNLDHPFYAADTKYSYGYAHSHILQRIEQFNNNVKVSAFDQNKDVNEGYLGRKIGAGRNWVNHAALRYRVEHDNFAATSQTTSGIAIPATADYQTVFLDLDTTKNHYVELTQLEKMSRIEDTNLGGSFKLSPGISPHQLTGQTSSTSLASNYSKTTLLKNDDVFSFTGDFSTRHAFEEPVDERYSLDLKYYNRHKNESTLVVHGRLDWGYRLDSDNQITLGNDNGLRAFRMKAFTGNKSLLFNIENRSFLVDDFASLISIGGVVFYDAGYVWPTGRPVALSDVRSDIGAGLRFGLTKSANEVVIRLDFAYRLQRSSTNDPHFVVSFGSSQAF